MRKIIILALLISTGSSFSQNWTLFGPAGIHANDILFNTGSNSCTVICTDSGVCVNNGTGYSWNSYNYGMPAHHAITYTGDTVLLAMGNGSYSDGIYKFDINTHTYHVSEWLPFCSFVKYCPSNSTYYAGSLYNGLLSSTDGITWNAVPYFIGKGCAAMDFYGQHIVVTQENNIIATYYSDDGGSTWNQSPSNIPIHDMAFGQNGVLYGVFTGISNSSGLYISHDYGHSWQMENFIDNMNVVGFDVVGNFFTGFHSALPTFEGVAMYDTTSNDFTFLNNTLPNKNINRFKINIILSSITLFACTDTGVYFSNDYLTDAPNLILPNSDLFIYPNPAKDFIKVTGAEKGVIEITDIKGQTVKTIHLNTKEKAIDISYLSPGEYVIRVKNGQNILKKKFVKQ